MPSKKTILQRAKLKREATIARDRMQRGEPWEDITKDGISWRAILVASPSADYTRFPNAKRCKECGWKAEVDTQGLCRACRLRKDMPCNSDGIKAKQ